MCFAILMASARSSPIRRNGVIRMSGESSSTEVSRQELQASIAKAVELRALHAALLQGSSPASIRDAAASPVAHSRHLPQFPAQDYPVFTPSYEGEEQVLTGIESKPLSGNWNKYGLGISSIAADTSYCKKAPPSSEIHDHIADDQKSSLSGSCADTEFILRYAKRNSLGEFSKAGMNSINSSIVVPLTDTHHSAMAPPKSRGISFSWLFHRNKKKQHKFEPSPDQEDQLSVEKLKKELMRATDEREAAILEVSEMRSSLAELKTKLEFLECYSRELKSALKEDPQKLRNLTTRREIDRPLDEPDGNNLMPVSEEVMVEGFLQIVSEARLSVNQFCKYLVAQVEETDETLTDSLNILLQPYKLSLHSKSSKSVLYHLEAIINQTLYQDFENSVFQKNGAPKHLDPHQDRQAQFASYVALRHLSWNQVLRKGTKYYSEEFSKFCDQKMSCIISMLMKWSNSWPEQLLQVFFVAAKCIWLLHLLAFSFDPPLPIMRVDENAVFDTQYMEDMGADRRHISQTDPSRVKIMVMPGFYVNDRVLRCKVIAKPKNSIDKPEVVLFSRISFKRHGVLDVLPNLNLLMRRTPYLKMSIFRNRTSRHQMNARLNAIILMQTGHTTDDVLYTIHSTMILPKNFNQMCLLLHKCMKQKALRPGKQLHAALLTSGTDMNRDVNSKLVGLYASCSDLKSAKWMFSQTLNPTVFALNWMVSASAFHGLYEDAIGYFQVMKMSPNKYTMYSVLKACVGLMDVRKGKEVHAVAQRLGLDEEILLSNILIDMYCKCEHLAYARKVFDKMTHRDVISWTCLICGYANANNLEEALRLFRTMKMEEGLEPNDFTWNALIAGFAQNGDSENATMLFHQMIMEGVVPDSVTWNALISGLAQNSQSNKALEYFRQMLVAGVRLNQVTITGLLPACGNEGSAERGQEIHGLVYRMGMEMSVFIGSALIDMYSKCCKPSAALSVFNQVLVKNVACWNAMIGCYGKHGMTDSSIQLFDRMQEEGAQPNEVTFTCILSACSYSGLLEKGLEIFSSMEMRHGVKPVTEHYACAVDLLCRSGRLAEAFEFLKNLPLSATDSSSICGAFFNGCKIHGRRDLAEAILGMDLKKWSGFVTLSNIYAADGVWHKVENVRSEMKHKGMHKSPGFSSVHT